MDSYIPSCQRDRTIGRTQVVWPAVQLSPFHGRELFPPRAYSSLQCSMRKHVETMVFTEGASTCPRSGDLLETKISAVTLCAHPQSPLECTVQPRPPSREPAHSTAASESGSKPLRNHPPSAQPSKVSWTMASMKVSLSSASWLNPPRRYLRPSLFSLRRMYWMGLSAILSGTLKINRVGT